MGNGFGRDPGLPSAQIFGVRREAKRHAASDSALLNLALPAPFVGNAKRHRRCAPASASGYGAASCTSVGRVEAQQRRVPAHSKTESRLAMGLVPLYLWSDDR